MIRNGYKDLYQSYSIYWHLYGGWRELFTSPYFHFAIAVTVVCSPIWFTSSGARVWADSAVNILPNLMGFSIAGMAIFLAFSNPTTMEAITEEGEPESYFTVTVASFFHFILVQTVALFLGFIGSFYESALLSAVGVLSLSYALLVSPAMAMQLLRTASLINAAASLPKKEIDT